MSSLRIIMLSLLGQEVLNNLQPNKISRKLEVALFQLHAQASSPQAVPCAETLRALAQVRMNGPRKASKDLISKLTGILSGTIINLVRVEP
jgi:hypothetical protein